MIDKEIPVIKKKNKGYFFVKRLLDILFSFTLLVILLPFFIIVSLIVLICEGYPILYISERIGKDGKPFKMIKFRTMIKGADKQVESLAKLNESDGPTFKIQNDPRMTKLGKLLRKTSIDELPQLINIFVGNMSFVGPRPPLANEVKQYNDYARLRLTAKPGLTCIWQCSGRNDIKFQQWMEMDVEYLQKRSIAFDFYLVLKTIPAVILEKGAK